MKTYAREITRRNTPVLQSQPLDKRQVKNNAGGYTYKLDVFKQLERFLILGTEGGTYYVGEDKLTQRNTDMVINALKTDYKRAIDMIVDVSVNGRAYKNTQAIYALALATSVKNENSTGTHNTYLSGVANYALSHLKDVCRTGTHILQFASFVDSLRGWTSLINKYVTAWYTDDINNSSFQIAKYRNRNGWTHADVMKLSHIKSGEDKKLDTLVKWTLGFDIGRDNLFGLPYYLELMNEAKTEEDVIRIAEVAKGDNIAVPWEIVPTYLKGKTFWEYTLPTMPLGALYRNLGVMASKDIFDSTDNVKIVEDKIMNESALKKARIHPMQAFVAKMVYENGQGIRGKLSWDVNRKLASMLEDSFYLTFGTLEPTNRRTMYAVDVSGSMTSSGMMGIEKLTPMLAATLMCLTLARVENKSNYGIYRFDTTLSKCEFSGQTSMNDAYKKIYNGSIGTDCSRPMVYAKDTNMKVDDFIVITDNETWGNSIHPVKALQDYRESSGINSKLVVIGMTATKFSIADPDDINSLDVVGFDTDTPKLVTDFCRE